MREVQKALNFNNPSTVYWHLNKLGDNGIIIQLQDDKYQVYESYQAIKKIPLPVTLDHYILAEKKIPEIVILLTFLISISITMFLMILFGLWFQAALVGFTSIISTLIIVLRFTIVFHFHLKKEINFRGSTFTYILIQKKIRSSAIQNCYSFFQR